MNTENKKKGLPKGQTNNPHGRPRGSKNKITTEIKNTLARFMKKDIKKLHEDWAKLNPYQRTIMREKLLNYILPKVSDEISIEQLEEYLKQIKQIQQ